MANQQGEILNKKEESTKSKKTTSTRDRAKILGGILTLIYLVFHITPVLNYLLNFPAGVIVFPIVSAVIMFFGLWWVLQFKISVERYITILGFASIITLVITFFAESILLAQSLDQQIFTLVLSSVFVFILYYIIILTMNILNLSYISDIPLGQAAKAAIYIIGLFVQLLAYFLIFANLSSPLFIFTLVFLLTTLFTYSTIATIDNVLEEKLLSSLGIGLVTTVMAIILALWPIPSVMIAFILVLVLYICVGVALEMKEKVSRYIWLEYGVLIFIILVSLLIYTSWGINGDLFNLFSV